MKLVKSSYAIIEQKPELSGIYEQIELGARNCYKSEGLIKYDEQGNSLTAKDFVDKIVNVYKHQSVAEHGTVYLHQHFDDGYRRVYGEVYQHYIHNPYSKVNSVIEKRIDGKSDYYITTNYRVILENGWLDDLKYLCNPTEHHEKRVTVRFICDRGVSHELVRHRCASFSQESTRYCNYSKEKFSNILTFVIPSWSDLPEGTVEVLYNTDYYINDKIISDYDENSGITNWFLESLEASEDSYLQMIKLGASPQQARQVLPNALKTEVIMTAFVSDWKKIFDLRCAENAHPDIRALMVPLQEEFIKRNYI